MQDRGSPAQWLTPRASRDWCLCYVYEDRIIVKNSFFSDTVLKFSLSHFIYHGIIFFMNIGDLIREKLLYLFSCTVGKGFDNLAWSFVEDSLRMLCSKFVVNWAKNVLMIDEWWNSWFLPAQKHLNIPAELGLHFGEGYKVVACTTGFDLNCQTL